MFRSEIAVIARAGSAAGVPVQTIKQAWAVRTAVQVPIDDTDVVSGDEAAGDGIEGAAHQEL